MATSRGACLPGHRLSMAWTTAVLEDICALDDIKHKKTSITNSIRNTTKKLLEMKDRTCLERLSTSIQKKYLVLVERVERYKLTATKRHKLWVYFHEFSLNEGYTACKQCDEALSLEADEMFWQLFLERGFLREVTKALKPTLAVDATGASRSAEVTDIEENAVRYTAGNIIRKLENRYSKEKTESGIECTRTLRDMGGQLHTRSKSSDQRSSDWTHLIDRGGLYHIEDLVYSLFLAIELISHNELSTILGKRGKNADKIRKDKLQWLCEDEEIQFLWCLISPVTIHEKSQTLLRDIIHLWLTTRIHSKVNKVIEDHKKEKASATKRRKALRKELKAITKEDS